METEALHEQIRAFLREALNVQGPEMDAETELVTTGLMDSMDVVRLVAYLERTLGITIPDHDIKLDHFDSIAKISRYVEARLES